MTAVEVLAPSVARRLQGDLEQLAAGVRASVVRVRGTRSGSGSGVVWGRDRLVVTNHHVVPGPAAEIELPGGERVPARVVSRSRSLDLVALEIDGDVRADGVRPATIRPSSGVRVGELVVAVGNPAGERNAITLGMVSANGPSRWPDGPRALLRVAITLWRGNSGGALADARGNVVGIPYMVAGAFALVVPSDVVEQFLLVAPDLGHSRRGAAEAL